MTLVKEDATIAVSLKVEHRWFFQSDDLISLHFLGGMQWFCKPLHNHSAIGPRRET